MKERCKDMYAIIKTGGKQYKVSVGDEIYVEKLDLEEKALTDTSAYLSNAGNGDESTIKTAIGQQMVQDKMDEIIEAMEVETTEEYDKITAYNVNTYLGFDADAYVEQGSGSAVGSAG